MDNFQDFIKSYAPQHFAIAAPLNLLINAVIMWYVVNQLSNIGEKVALWRAGLCAALLYGVSDAAPDHTFRMQAEYEF